MKWIVPVFPEFIELPYHPDFRVEPFGLVPTPALKARTSWAITDEPMPSRAQIDRIVGAAITDPTTAASVKIATAHLVAINALQDPLWRRDQYRTRVDEWIAPIWELAQEVFEANADAAAPQTHGFSRIRRAVGLERAGRKWASGHPGVSQ
jgi:hypothetical protein